MLLIIRGFHRDCLGVYVAVTCVFVCVRCVMVLWFNLGVVCMVHIYLSRHD